MRKRRTLAVLALMAAPPTLRAQANDPRAVQPERPTVATHAHTVAAGYIEIETGVEGDRFPDGRSWFAPTVVKLGIASHVQLNISAPFNVATGPRPFTGLGDISLGLKWRILDDHPLLGDFAVLPAVKLSSASANTLGTGGTDLGLTLISSHEFGGTSMDLNAAYTRTSVGSVDDGSTALWTISFGFPVTSRIGWAAELYGFPTVDGSAQPSIVSFLTGPTFSIATSFAMDAGIIAPIHGGAPSALYAGLVWNLGRFWPSDGSSSLARGAPKGLGRDAR